MNFERYLGQPSFCLEGIFYDILLWEGTVVAASFLTIVVKFLINHELFHWETYTKKS